MLADNRTELFSTRPDGSGDTLVSAVPAAGNVATFAWAPDGSRILYLADQVTDGVFELFTARPDGSDNVVVSGLLAPDEGVVDFRWMSDASSIAYRADQLVNGRFELFLTSPGGGPASAAISGPLVDQGDVFAFATR